MGGGGSFGQSTNALLKEEIASLQSQLEKVSVSEKKLQLGLSARAEELVAMQAASDELKSRLQARFCLRKPFPLIFVSFYPRSLLCQAFLKISSGILPETTP